MPEFLEIIVIISGILVGILTGMFIEYIINERKIARLVCLECRIEWNEEN